METMWMNLKGFLYGFLLFTLLTLLVSVGVKLTPAPEGWSLYYMIGVLSLCCLFIGTYFGKHMKRKGILFGGLYSMIFLLILSAFYMLAFSTNLEFGFDLMKYLVPILVGSVGGMIGVNMQN